MNQTAKRSFFQFDNSSNDSDYRMVSAIAISPSGELLMCSTTRGHIHAFAVATGNELYRIQHRIKGKGFANVRFGKHNDHFACYCDDIGLQVRQATQGRVVRTISDAYCRLLIDPDHSPFIGGIDLRDDYLLQVWRWDKAKQLPSIRLDRPKDTSLLDAFAIAFSPDGKTIATGGIYCPLDTWDLNSGKHLHRFIGSRPKISSLIFTPDGKTIATAHYDASIRLWNATDGTLKRKLASGMKIPDGGGVVIRQVRYSPDGKTLAYCGMEPRIHRINPATGKKLSPINTGEIAVDCFVFTPDGKHLFSGGPSGIKKWDLTTGKEIRFKTEKD